MHPFFFRLLRFSFPILFPFHIFSFTAQNKLFDDSVNQKKEHRKELVTNKLLHFFPLPLLRHQFLCHSNFNFYSNVSFLTLAYLTNLKYTVGTLTKFTYKILKPLCATFNLVGANKYFYRKTSSYCLQQFRHF